MEDVLEDAFGNALGNSIVGKLSQPGEQTNSAKTKLQEQQIKAQQNGASNLDQLAKANDLNVIVSAMKRDEPFAEVITGGRNKPGTFMNETNALFAQSDGLIKIDTHKIRLPKRK